MVFYKNNSLTISKIRNTCDVKQGMLEATAQFKSEI